MNPTRFLAAMAIALAPSLADADMLAGFDVAEDHTRFIFDEAPVFDDGMPAFGNAFVTQGYIYPAGTLDGGVEGVLPDGAPAFPDLVIGEWTCDGYFVGEGMRTQTGAMVITRQIYAFEDGDILISQGAEPAEAGASMVRAITGGTGDYAAAPAALTQLYLGMSDGFGVRLQLRLGDARSAAVNDAWDARRPDATEVEWDSGVPVGSAPVPAGNS